MASSSSSWYAAYQKAVDSATNQTKSLREFIADKHGSLDEATKQLRDAVSTVTRTVSTTVSTVASRAHQGGSPSDAQITEMNREMGEYGITDEYADAVRSKLEYSIFRDFEKANGENLGGRMLNAWQERHVTLLLQRVNEVDALRYALCPKYMDDGVFWGIYFELTKKMLPPIAFEWTEGCSLPRRYDEVVKPEGKVSSFAYIESRLRDMRKVGESVGSKMLQGDDSREARRARKESGDSGSKSERQEEQGNVDITGDTTEDVKQMPEDHAGSLEDRRSDDDVLDDEELDAYLTTLALSSDEEDENEARVSVDR